MVTRTSNTNDLSSLLDERDSKKWDLVDPVKRDAWLLSTVSELKAEPATWAAVEFGPPTVERVMLKSPGMTRARAKQVSVALADEYDTHNGKGFKILVNRTDFKKRPALAARLAKNGGGFYCTARTRGT